MYLPTYLNRGPGARTPARPAGAARRRMTTRMSRSDPSRRRGTADCRVAVAVAEAPAAGGGLRMRCTRGRLAHSRPPISICMMLVALLACAAAGACAAAPIATGGESSRASVAATLGIRYAVPPRGALRFRESVLLDEPASFWAPSADTFGPSCLQADSSGGSGTSEDCLFLNVWSGGGCDRAAPCPVHLFIHGGSFISGSGAQYNGSALARRGLVVASINYRLGPLGFLPAPRGESGGDSTLGLNGLADQVTALRWVQRHISAYGGSGDSVTVAGESAGSLSVYMLSVSRLARGLFRHAIMQSGAGGPWSPQPFNSSEATYQAFLRAVGAKSLDELRQLPAEAVSTWPPAAAAAVATIDRHVLHVDPALLFAQEQEINPAAFIIGANSRDGILPFVLGGPFVPRTLFAANLLKTGLYGPVGAAEVSAQYNASDGGRFVGDIQGALVAGAGDHVCTCPTKRLAAQIAASTRGRVPVWTYTFAHLYRCGDMAVQQGWNVREGEVSGAQWASHASEIRFVFSAGEPDFVFSPNCGALNKTADLRVSQVMGEMWSEFTISGIPYTYFENQWDEWQGGVEEGRSYFFGGADGAGGPELGMATPEYEREKREDCKFWQRFEQRHGPMREIEGIGRLQTIKTDDRPVEEREACGQANCSGHGRCAKLFLAAADTVKPMCQCFEGFGGAACSQATADNSTGWRVVGFHTAKGDTEYNSTADAWKTYDWTRLTTVVNYGNVVDPAMVQHARAHNVSVLGNGCCPPTTKGCAACPRGWTHTSLLLNATQRALAIDGMVSFVVQHSLDGFNFVSLASHLPHFHKRRSIVTPPFDLCANYTAGYRGKPFRYK